MVGVFVVVVFVFSSTSNRNTNKSIKISAKQSFYYNGMFFKIWKFQNFLIVYTYKITLSQNVTSGLLEWVEYI